MALIIKKEEALNRVCPFALNQRIELKVPPKIDGGPPGRQTIMQTCIGPACMSWFGKDDSGFCSLLQPGATEDIEMELAQGTHGKDGN